MNEVLDFAVHIVYTITLLFCRFLGIVFYHHIYNLHDRFGLAVKIFAGVIIAGYLP